jgi:hypothetical protein
LHADAGVTNKEDNSADLFVGVSIRYTAMMHLLMQRRTASDYPMNYGRAIGQLMGISRLGLLQPSCRELPELPDLVEVLTVSGAAAAANPLKPQSRCAQRELHREMNRNLPTKIYASHLRATRRSLHAQPTAVRQIAS